jgi:hypothetical protein
MLVCVFDQCIKQQWEVIGLICEVSQLDEFDVGVVQARLIQHCMLSWNTQQLSLRYVRENLRQYYLPIARAVFVVLVECSTHHPDAPLHIAYVSRICRLRDRTAGAAQILSDLIPSTPDRAYLRYASAHRLPNCRFAAVTT